MPVFSYASVVNSVERDTRMNDFKWKQKLNYSRDKKIAILYSIKIDMYLSAISDFNWIFYYCTHRYY